MGSSKDDFHCTSSIDESKNRGGCYQFLFTIRTWIHFHPAGTQNGAGARVFTVQDWTEDEKSFFKKRFSLEITSGWGNGACWLAHSKKGTPGLWCDVKIDYVEDRAKAHLCVNAVNKPVLTAGGGDNYYRGECKSKKGESVEGGSTAPELNKKGNTIDMHIPNNEVVKPPTVRDCGTSDAGTVTIKQNILWHEFGHYLGLPHTCAGQGTDGGYCSGLTRQLQENLMAKGNTFYTVHAKPFADRLKLHTDFLEAKHNVFWFIAKNINSSPGGGDRQTPPWKGTSWENSLKIFQQS